MRIYEGSIFHLFQDEKQRHDVLYDKDAFGALHPTKRDEYLTVVKQYLKNDALVLLSGKLHEKGSQIESFRAQSTFYC